jgi:gluconate kinase
MKNRKEHFMPEALLNSQLATLERPGYAWSFSIEKEPEEIVNEIVGLIKIRS